MKNKIQSTNLKPKKSHVRPRIFAYAAVGVIAAVLMVGGARWYGENQAKKNADKEIQALQQQVSSLQKKVNDSKNKVQKDDVKTKEKGYLNITEFGIKIPLTKEINDAIYAVVDIDNVAVSVERLADVDPGCDIMADSNGGSVGMIVKAPLSEVEPISGENIQKARPDGTVVDGFYYYYLPAQSACTDKMIDLQDAVYKSFLSAGKKIEAL